MSKSQSQTNKLPIQNFVLLIVAFLFIGMLFGPNAGQVYTGISVTGSDTVELTNDGNLDTKVRDFSLTTTPIVGAAATGGTETTDGDYYVHTFTSDGTFTPSVPLDIEVLIVAGGGVGGERFGTGSAGSGGGAGGVVEDAFSVSAQSYEVMVGRGGNSAKANGEDSSFNDITSYGGGYGGGKDAGGWYGANNGGSGAGQTEVGAAGTGVPGQGHDGGLKGLAGSYPYGGGAGAGEDGGDAIGTTICGDGGDGISSSISGTATYYGGGGVGGHTYTGGVDGTGGLGGGGNAGADGIDGTGGGGGAGSHSSGLGFGMGGDGIVIIRYLNPLVDVTDPSVSVGDDKLYYDGILASTLTYSDGRAFIDVSDVTASVKGTLPVVKVGTVQNIKIDHDLQYSITYVPKNMDITSPDMFRANADMRIDSRLTDTSGNPVSNQPLEMRARLFDSADKRYLDEIISSTSFVIPGEYIKSGGHYQLRLSYNGFEFGGWSNEILADFDVGTEGFTITSSPDKAPEGLAAASFAAASNLVGMAVTGWLDIPIIGGIIKFIAGLTGVTL